jgi:Sortase (surface protein transpeptidase)
VLVVAMRGQHHAPQPPTSAAHPAAEGNAAAPAPHPSTDSQGSHATPVPAATVGPILTRSAPVSLSVPRIGIKNAPLARYGLDKHDEVAIPPSRANTPAGWFTGSPTPGQLGPSVIVGHVDSDSGPSVFFRLGQSRAGDRTSVTLADHRVAVFEVDSVERFKKADFPTLRVYGNLDHAGLRLITCGGAYDTSIHHYVDNIVVYAHLVSSHPA